MFPLTILEIPFQVGNHAERKIREGGQFLSRESYPITANEELFHAQKNASLVRRIFYVYEKLVFAIPVAAPRGAQRPMKSAALLQKEPQII